MLRVVVFDLETTGLSVFGSPIQLARYPDRGFAWAFKWEDGTEKYFRFRVNNFTREVMYQENWRDYQDIKSILEDPSTIKVGHNVGFDIQMAAYAGIQVKGKIYDTKVLSHIADSSRLTFALKPLTKLMFGYPDDDQKDLQASVIKARRLGKKLGWSLAEDPKADYHLGDPELCKKYAMGDVERTLKLFNAYQPLLKEKQEFYSPYSHYAEIVDIEHQLLPIVAEMSKTGVAIDLKKVSELDSYYRQCITKANEAKAALGFADLNPSSPKQMMEVFYNQLDLDKEFKNRKKEDGTKEKTLTADKRALEKWSKDVPLASTLLELSEAGHQLDSFILPFKENSFDEKGHRVLHPSFNSTGPVTGRLSCSRPNLQNVTSSTSPGRKSSVEFKARECIVPRKGHLWMLGDYSQIEVLVAAYSSQDTLMMETIAAGKSVHDLTCERVFGHKPDYAANKGMYRKMAKILTFSVLYGSGPKAIAELLGISYDEAKVYYTNFWETYAGISRFNETLKRAVTLDGFVKDPFGRPYFIEKKFAYKALNAYVQGFSAGVIKRAMIGIQQTLEARYKDTKLLLSIHDEAVLECPVNTDLKNLAKDFVMAMQGDYHSLIGMPNKFVVEVSIVRENWGKKEAWNG